MTRWDEDIEGEAPKVFRHPKGGGGGGELWKNCWAWTGDSENLVPQLYHMVYRDKKNVVSSCCILVDLRNALEHLKIRKAQKIFNKNHIDSTRFQNLLMGTMKTITL